MKKIVLSLILIACFFVPETTQAQDSSRLRVSLLTCTPGEELYAIFGHSALRIIDSNSVTDYVFNYGTFNFDDEGFYLKFIRGKLMYYISLEEFRDFQYSYQMAGREMTEQVLNFTAAEKKAIQQALFENLKEENKYYAYDFFLDNCTTRLRDLIIRSKQPQPVLPAVMPENTRFRHAIHAYLNRGKQYWSKLGIDLLLGAPTDQVMTVAQQQFLPDNLLAALDKSQQVRIVNSSANLYELPDHTPTSGVLTPMVLFGTLMLLVVLGSLSKNKAILSFLTRLDGLLFFLTGLLGLILVFMWTSTDHSMTKNNYNLLWAWPTHLVGAFLINSKKTFAKRYFLFTAIMMLLVLFAWFFVPQQLNIALIPWVLTLLFRAALKGLS